MLINPKSYPVKKSFKRKLKAWLILLLAALIPHARGADTKTPAQKCVLSNVVSRVNVIMWIDLKVA